LGQMKIECRRHLLQDSVVERVYGFI
jgi:hypothetical protein